MHLDHPSESTNRRRCIHRHSPFRNRSRTSSSFQNIRHSIPLQAVLVQEVQWWSWSTRIPQDHQSQSIRNLPPSCILSDYHSGCYRTDCTVHRRNNIPPSVQWVFLLVMASCSLLVVPLAVRSPHLRPLPKYTLLLPRSHRHYQTARRMCMIEDRIQCPNSILLNRIQAMELVPG